MRKIQSNKNDFLPIKREGTSIIISYEYQDLENNEATWFEVSLSKNQYPYLISEDIKNAILKDIDSQTDDKILSGYQWTILHGNDAGRTVKVWLSKENQENFKAKHDAAIMYPQLVEFPIVYKISENEDKSPIYESFQTIEELAQFYLGGVAYINNCLQEGWQRKDNINWNSYIIPDND